MPQFALSLLAFAPILVVLVLMIGFRRGGSQAGLFGWLSALAIAVLAFGADLPVVLVSLARAGFLALYVLYVIWPGLFLYNLVRETGGINIIAGRLLRLSPHTALQLLVLAWVFSAFLEGVSGFGIPVAVVAPMLIAAGFAPVTAVAASAIGHAWAVTFGSFGIGFVVLQTASQEGAAALGGWVAVMLSAACLMGGLAVAHVFRGWRSFYQALPAVLVIGAVMGGTLYLLVINGLYMLAGFGSGLAGLGASALVSRLPYYRSAQPEKPAAPPAQDTRELSLFQAVLPYLLVLVFVVAAQFIAPVGQFLAQVQITMPLPETVTRLGFSASAGMGKSTSLLGDPGGLMIFSIIISYLLYRRSGRLETGALKRVAAATLQNAGGASLGILSMVALAMIMSQSGMTHTLAVGLSSALSAVYPLVAPFIGLLGVFVTGSNTNSNVMFAMLQKQSTLLLELAVPVILGAQNAGGAVGSMLAPAKIIVGCSTSGLVGQEGQVIRRTAIYGLVIALALGVIALLAA